MSREKGILEQFANLTPKTAARLLSAIMGTLAALARDTSVITNADARADLWTASNLVSDALSKMEGKS